MQLLETYQNKVFCTLGDTFLKDSVFHTNTKHALSTLNYTSYFYE